MAYSEVFAWGSDSHGQLSLAAAAKPHPLPRFCSLNFLITAISCGDRHTAFLDSQGRVFTVGCNARGQLGLGRPDVQFTTFASVVDALVGETIEQMACGGDHTLVLTDKGQVYSWGDGTSGALGTGRWETLFSPEKLTFPGQYRVRQISAGLCHSAFLVDSEIRADIAFTCGDGQYGQLCLDNRESQNYPSEVDVGEAVQQVACGRTHTVLLTVSDKVVITTESGVVVAEGVGHVEKVAAGRHSAALTVDGRVYIWASDEPHTVVAPLKLPQSLSVADISLGDGFAAVVDSNRQVWTWGVNDRGELGLGDYMARTVPTQVSALHTKRVRAVVCGKDFILALGRDVRKGASTLNIGEVVSARATPRPQSTISFDFQSIPNSTRGTRAIATSGRGEENWERKAMDALRQLAEEKRQRALAETELANRASDLALIAEKLKAKESALLGAQRDVDELKAKFARLAQKDAIPQRLDTRREAEMEKKESEIATLRSLLEKCRLDLQAKSQEIRQVSADMETQSEELRKRASQEERAKQDMERTLRTLTKQLKDSESALLSAKQDIAQLNADLQNGPSRKDREVIAEQDAHIEELKSEIADLKDLLGEKDEQLQSAGASSTAALASLSSRLEKVTKENLDLRQQCCDLESALADLRELSTVTKGHSGDLQDQLLRITRELRLTKDTLQRAEEHNQQLLEAMERKSLAKAREYREKSLSVLKTPSPLRTRPKSPVPALGNLALLRSLQPPQLQESIADENQGKGYEKERSEKERRPVLQEQTTNHATPPTFRANP